MNMGMFLSEYKLFISHEDLKDLSDNSKINLFKVYCNIMMTKSNQSKPQDKPKSTQSTQSEKMISKNQFGLLKSLMDEGYVENCDLNITMKKASMMIKEGLDNKKNAEENKEENKEEKKEFAGSYNHGNMFSS